MRITSGNRRITITRSHVIGNSTMYRQQTSKILFDNNHLGRGTLYLVSKFFFHYFDP